MGKIIGFEVFESDDIVHLASEAHRPVIIGSAWTDVFIWKERVFVGTPQEIWNALEEERDQMLSAVPITGLDLALSVPDQNVAPLLGSAVDFMRNRFGDEKALAWQYGTLARQQVLIGLRRLSLEIGLDPTVLSALSGLELLSRGFNELVVQIPADVTRLFERVGRVEDLHDRTRQIVERLGLVVFDEELLESTVETYSSSDPADETAAQEGDRDVRILVVVAGGRRAFDIARLITLPEWRPTDIGQGRITVDVEEVGQNPPKKFVRGRLDRPSSAEPPGGGYDVVVLLADDEAFMSPRVSSLHEALLSRLDSEWNGISVIAPALPEDVPSRALSDQALLGEFGAFGFNAVIDTSVARSPFWTGNPRRAFDRRIADVIAGSAVLCGMDGPLRRRLKENPLGAPEQLLTFAFGYKNRGELGLASEVTWAHHGHSAAWSARFTAKGFPRGAGTTVDGIVQLRDRRTQFDNFATAVLHDALPVGFADFISEIDVPPKIKRDLAFPDLAAGFKRASEAFKGIAICAEAPSFAALKAAGRQGWAIIRYTDRESIREILMGGSNVGLPFMPRQIRLPPLSRRPENKGLATRGIDPRDVVRLTVADWETWKTRMSSSLRAEMRHYRASLSRPRAAEGREYVLPRRTVQQAAESGDAEARSLLRHVDRRAGRDRHYLLTGKRPADLRVAWSKPARGLSRYILSDGVVPCEFAELNPNEVPAQRFFIIDGDGAVPALLGSRIFAAWARITLTRSMSWMPRFSVGRTFETFPVLPPFLVTRAGVGPVRLTLVDNKRLRTLAEELRSLYHQRSMDSAKNLRLEIDRAILRQLKLAEDASDLAIVELLLQAENAR
ncbi:hypothetical protein QA633_02945 [Bradyrhizobium barranii]|uniref:hypothetical protein n=1 Tax=Bradyrhizobium barranii TaxID=2992140 RepID=UPI0024B25289|nr:hypothetical protein [Bradyrhizobium barranii]WFT96092.1 hypothetical protein QA633_02945 [Bradyrhizobium barranii]